MGLRDVLARVRRPWSSPLLVGVTAVVAAASGYVIASPATDPSQEPITVVLGDWIVDEPVAAVDDDGRGAEALAAAPAGVTPFRRVLVQRDDMPYAESLLALPSGSYRVYASCRHGKLPFEGSGTAMSLTVQYGGEYAAARLPCPSDAAEPVLTLNLSADAVLHLNVLLADADSLLMQPVPVALGVFVEKF